MLYEWLWEEKALEEIQVPSPLGHWLILSDGEASNKMNLLFENKGASTRCISSENHPKTKDEFVALLKSESFDGILHLASTAESTPLSAESIASAQALGAKSFLHLCQALVQVEETLKIPLFFVTQNSMSKQIQNSPLMGLYKTTVMENPALQIKLIDLGSNWDAELLFHALLSKSQDNLLLIQDDRAYVPRLLKSRDAKLKRLELTRPLGDQFRLRSKQKGLLHNLSLVPLSLKESLNPHEVEVDVRAVGLNFRDVLNALDLYPGDPGELGGDGAGIVIRVGEAVNDLKPGDEVLGMMSGCLARKRLGTSRQHHDQA